MKSVQNRCCLNAEHLSLITTLAGHYVANFTGQYFRPLDGNGGACCGNNFNRFAAHAKARIGRNSKSLACERLERIQDDHNSQ
jgi:hypothetical protein